MEELPTPLPTTAAKGPGFPEIGITSTPVIDAAKTTNYVVAKTVTGAGRDTGPEFSLACPRSDDRQRDAWGAGYQLQATTWRRARTSRSYVPDTAPGAASGEWHPSTSDLAETAAISMRTTVGCSSTTRRRYSSRRCSRWRPDGKKASIWQGGDGPAADQFGNIYVATANGTYDGPAGENDYGDSVLKLGWNGNNFGITEYFTPYNQLDLSTKSGSGFVRPPDSARPARSLST